MQVSMQELIKNTMVDQFIINNFIFALEECKIVV